MSYDKVKQAKRTLAIGAKQTKKAVVQGNADEVYIALDAEDKVIYPIVQMCKNYGVAVVRVDSMRKLGRASGIDVGAAVVALLK